MAEADELFYVNLVVSEAQVPVTHLDFATGTIRDDEVRSLTVADASAVEGDSMTFTATLGKAVTGGVTTVVGYTDGTAVHGVDYRVNASVTFAGTAGETKTFTVATIGDSDEEENETFTVRLLHTSGTQVATATGTIVDNDGPPSVTVSDASATEGDRMMFTLTLDKAVPPGADGDADLHRRHRHQGHRLHRARRLRHPLRRLGWRDADLLRVDHRGHRRGGRRDPSPSASSSPAPT